jgi:glutamine amidotransferase
MCRHYAFRANEPTKVECTLVRAQNALLVQSRKDMGGQTHSDGWGIAVYYDGFPEVERRAKPAYDDLHFNDTAQKLFAKTVVAHVRKASVGEPSLANTHPFVHGYWCLTHNGRISGFSKLEKELLHELDPHFRPERRGATDSELLFYWLLTRMENAGISADQRCTDGEKLAKLFAASIADIARRCKKVSTHIPRLNVTLTDGNVLVASRWNRSLWWTYHDFLKECEYCGVPHVEHREGMDYKAVVVASEPFSHEPWHEFPQHAVLMVDDNIEPVVHKIE